MNPGILRHKINILTTTEGTNEAGDTILIPSVYKTVWASVSPVSGKDYLEAKKLQAELTYKFILRYTSGVTPDMQIEFKGRIFLIQDILNPLEINETIEIMAIERVIKNG
ncbi:phage head-tail adaptor, putative, SPP1 family [Desulfosporosinus acidiphilus SJ4]|uniref:Phage head-tail adaptor, putative, SPP1 family n=1 Tax=Desulfosporosinus acidiphilus (strain DSM 22704 / JCM 16185 / SJ4) TaxID=646529 RepID=I4D3F6_DESAJ|nr:phage head closure protein [Desulfosporosinus acidiphilus]AFM40330.1 phage head-tail adaptor, putative, SPP1 family [Desulfosporosinus acidiphilus SJ4]